MMSCADPTFGLNHQALAILQFLAARPPSFAPYDSELGRYKVHIRTYPWFNGREKGVALVIHRDSGPVGPCRVVVFGESRGTDMIFVEHWEEPFEPLNGPSLIERERLVEAKEKAGAKTVTRLDGFEEGEVGAAADVVYGLMEEFYKEGKRALKLVGKK